MKKTLTIFFIFSCIIFSYSTEKYIVNGNKINIRSKPNISSIVASTASKGDILLIDTIIGEWARISINNSFGYANVNNIKKVIDKTPSNSNDKTNTISQTKGDSYSWLKIFLIIVALIIADFYFIKGFFSTIIFEIVMFIKELFLKSNTGIEKTKSDRGFEAKSKTKKNPEPLIASKTKEKTEKPIEYLPLESGIDIHNYSEQEIINFFDTEDSKITTIKKFGSAIKIKNIQKEIGLKALIKIITVSRREYLAESPELKYKKAYIKEPVNKFDYPYLLPDTFPIQSFSKKSILFESIEARNCEPEQLCTLCRGTGKCYKCNGLGHQICFDCNGTKYNTTGKKYGRGNNKFVRSVCITCEGRGVNKCNVCHESKTCNRCDGNGVETCIRCNGSSNYQSFKEIETTYKSFNVNYNFTSNKKLEEIISKSINSIAFSDDIIEYENQSSILFDNIEKAQNINNHVKTLIDSVELVSKIPNEEKVGRINLTIENAPITIVNYTYNKEQYMISFVGENKLVYYDKIPKNEPGFISWFR